jgi:uncharacterized protein
MAFEHYRVDLAPILEVIGADMTVSDSVELEPLHVADETFTFTKPVTFEVTLTNTAAGVVASGMVHAVVSTECSRCLEHFDMPLDGEVEAFYVGPEHAAEMPEEQETEPIRDARIDLAPAIMTALVVEAPFAPVHAEDCKGICTTCGANLNVEECTCPPQREESPFNVLKGMFPEGGE